MTQSGHCGLMTVLYSPLDLNSPKIDTLACLWRAIKRMERRLAAILAADVAGYSRLMGIDQEGTHKDLKAHRHEFG